MAEHAEAVLSAWEMDGVVLVGEGMGAAVALEVAARGNIAVKAVTAVGGAAATFDLDEEIEQLAAITAGRARRQFDTSGYAPDTDRDVYTVAFQEWVKTDPRRDRRGSAGPGQMVRDRARLSGHLPGHGRQRRP